MYRLGTTIFMMAITWVVWSLLAIGLDLFTLSEAIGPGPHRVIARFLLAAPLAYFMWSLRGWKFKAFALSFGVFITPVTGLGYLISIALSAWWIHRMFWKGYRQIKGGNKPEIGIPMLFGRPQSIVTKPGPGWIWPIDEERSFLHTTSRIPVTFTVRTHQYTSDRVGFWFNIEVVAAPMTDEAGYQRFLNAGGWKRIAGKDLETNDPKAKSRIKSAIGSAAREAMSSFDMETVLGFADRTARVKSGEDKGKLKTTHATPRTILKGKLDFEEIIWEGVAYTDVSSEGIAGRVAPWGVEIVSVDIDDLEPDEGAKRAIERVEEEKYNREGELIAHNTALEKARLLHEAKEKNGITDKEYELVHSLDIRETAARRGGPLGAILDKLIGE